MFGVLSIDLSIDIGLRKIEDDEWDQNWSVHTTQLLRLRLGSGL